MYFFDKEAMNSISGLLGMGIGMSSFGSIEVPFFKTFIYGFIFIAVWFAVVAAMIYVIANVILKDKIDIKKAFALVGVCSVFTAATTLVDIVCTFISMKIMLIVLLVAAVFYLTYLYQGISEITEVAKNKLAYVFVPSLTVAIFVVVYILPKILF